MDNNIKITFEEYLNMDLVEIIVSNSTDKNRVSKIKIRPLLLKEQLFFQQSIYKGKQVLHKNKTKEELLDELNGWFEFGLLLEVRENDDQENTNIVFRQAELKSKERQATILISKKGKATIKKKHNQVAIAQKSLDHNRKKSYILEEGIPVPFLIDLGVMTGEGKIVKTKYDKFKQINRFLEFIEDILPYLDRDRELTMIDFGCGKSYLTFAMYYYLKVLKEYDINMIGLDLKEDVIKHCNKLSANYGYDTLRFLCGDIESFEGIDEVDVVVTLHACDTATDYALYKAVNWNARVILSVPCCQHEVNKQLKEETVLHPMLKYGLIKERTASLITDSVRANLLEWKGYKTQILEFIDMEHTPKNILIRAVKDKKHKDFENSSVNTLDKTEKNNEKRKEIEGYMEFLGINPTLYQLFMKEN